MKGGSGLKPRHTVERCLFTLGANYAEVYHPNNTNRSHMKRSIYHEYTIDQLLSWAKHLYYQSAKKYHPDLNSGNDDKMKQMNKAYAGLKRILSYKLL